MKMGVVSKAQTLLGGRGIYILQTSFHVFACPVSKVGNVDSSELPFGITNDRSETRKRARRAGVEVGCEFLALPFPM